MWASASLLELDACESRNIAGFWAEAESALK